MVRETIKIIHFGAPKQHHLKDFAEQIIRIGSLLFSKNDQIQELSVTKWVALMKIFQQIK